MAKSVFRRGTCPICNAAEVKSRHYSLKHGVRLRNHFSPTRKGRAPGEGYQLSCIAHPDVLCDGPHEAMAHVKEAHPEIVPPDSVALGEGKSEVDPEWALANATVGGVFEFLLGERRKAEAEAAGLRVCASTLEGEKEELTRGNRALHEQNGQLRTERDQAIAEKDRLKAENTDLARDNRSLNAQTLRFRNGAKSAAEFREVHGELQGRRT